MWILRETIRLSPVSKALVELREEEGEGAEEEDNQEEVNELKKDDDEMIIFYVLYIKARLKY